MQIGEEYICICGKAFKRAREPFRKRLPHLTALCGGLETKFSGTSTVEANFSINHWEKDKYRTCLSERCLKGIIYCKQQKEKEKLKHN